MRNRPIHDLVEPGEIVDTPLLLALRPSRLKPDLPDAERRQKFAVLLEVGKVAVEAFTPDRPHGVADFRRHTRRKRAKTRQIYRERCLHPVGRR